MPSREHGAVRRLSTIALFAAVATSTMSLPRDVLPWTWLLALTLPAGLLGLRRSPPRRPFLRALMATILQLSACILAYQIEGAITRPAALAGTILPPMMFVTVRRLDVDATLGLFLSLCVLLVGTILGQTAHWVIGVYLVAAVLQLRCEARLDALRTSSSQPTSLRRRRLPVPSWIGLGLLSVLIAFAVDRSLQAIPSLVDEERTQDRPAGESGPRSIGLSDRFILDGGGELLDMQGAQLCEVHSMGRRPVPENLYLRSGFFENPGLDAWGVGKLAHQAIDASTREWRMRLPMAGAATTRIEIIRSRAARDRVFTPPGTCAIYGLSDVIVDSDREFFRQPNPQPDDVYEVLFQSLPPPPFDQPVASGWAERGLLAVPGGVDHPLLRSMLDECRATGSALQKAAAIAGQLDLRCDYLRREPAGPYSHSLLNFLDGERTGYCMHFASAAAIMLRMSGVPCRIGVGLYGGDPSATEGSRIYGSKHAHAWVEIPFAERGWVVFDPTPPSERGQGNDLAPTESDSQPETAGDDNEPALSLYQQLLDLVNSLISAPWPWIVLLALLLLRPHTRAKKRRIQTLSRTSRPARRWLLQILKALSERGQVRAYGTTLEQLSDQLADRDRLPSELHSALLAYQEVRFGGRQWGNEIEERMREGLRAAQSLPKFFESRAHRQSEERAGS